MLLMLIAYALVWLGLLGYVWSLARRQQRVAEELEELRGQVEALGGGEGAGAPPPGG